MTLSFLLSAFRISFILYLKLTIDDFIIALEIPNMSMHYRHFQDVLKIIIFYAELDSYAGQEDLFVHGVETGCSA